MTPPRVLFVAGHDGIEGITADHLAGGQAWADRLRGQTGTHGEREWTGDFVQRAAAALNATGVIDASFTDAVWHADVYDGITYAFVIECHYQRDTPSERAMFATVDPALVGPVISQEARDRSQRLVDRLVAGYEAATGIAVTEPRVSLNMTQLYAYDYPSADSGMLCIEFGEADVDTTVLYTDDGIARIVGFLRDSILAELGLTAPAPPPQPVSDAAVLAPPVELDAVHEWASIYRDEAPRAGIRPEIALAQALHETGRFTFPGIAQPDWNNPCGLGVTGPGQGARFATKRDGVIAHLQHLLFYFAAAHTPYCTPPTLDPRHFAHRGYPNDLHQLDGHWAVPGNGYADAILALVPEARTLLG